MRVIDVHEAKSNLSRLIDQATQGDGFIIAKAGKPMVKVIALDAPASEQKRRLGFMLGEIKVPSDFDRMGAEDIERLV